MRGGGATPPNFRFSLSSGGVPPVGTGDEDSDGEEIGLARTDGLFEGLPGGRGTPGGTTSCPSCNTGE